VAVTVYLSPFSTLLQVFNPLGTALLSGGLIYTYKAGTTTLQATYTDATGTVANANPIQLNASGQLNNEIWQPIGVTCKFVIGTNSGTVGSPVLGTQIGPTFDNVAAIADPTGIQTTFYGGTDTGAVNAYVLTIASFPTAYTNGQIIYWVPANSNTGASTININSLGAINITNVNGSSVGGGQIIANQVSTIVIQGGNAVLLSGGTAASLSTGSFVPTWTGFSSAPTGTMFWSRQGNAITLAAGLANMTGASNAPTMTITNLPSAIRPATTKGNATFQGYTAGVDFGGNVRVNWSYSSTGVITFGLNETANGGFTGSGSKGLQYGALIVYDVTL